MKMFPSKGMVDYMTEMNRLFPRKPDNEMQQSYASPYQMANRSSSSTDSTSPESFPDLYKKPDIRPDTRYYEPRLDISRPIEPQVNPESIYETPRPYVQSQRQRPIVGRKIIDDYTQNVFYELFSGENRGFEFKTPVKTANPITVPSNSVSPSMSLSPNSRYTSSPVPSNYYPRSPIRNSNYPGPQNYGNIRPNLRNTEMVSQKMCTFCRKNGETPVVYMTHSVKERVGNKQIVTCPILRSHVCATCNATGDDAHTITYCPVLRITNNGAPLRSTTITLKNTRVMSNGRRRY